MIAVIMISNRCKMNPDNLATPLAASVGDLVSISVLATIASFLFSIIDTDIWILYVILGAYLCLLPIWVWIVLNNRYTRNVLTSGWTPVLSALFISGSVSIIRRAHRHVLTVTFPFQLRRIGPGPGDRSFRRIRHFPAHHKRNWWQPRLCTSFQNIHDASPNFPTRNPAATFKTSRFTLGSALSRRFARLLTIRLWISIVYQSTFVHHVPVPYAKTARILLGMALPGQLVFIFVADYIQWGYSTLHVYFVVAYLSVALIQVSLTNFSNS